MASLRDFTERELPTRRPALAHMCAFSVAIRGGEAAEVVRQWARSLIEAGPVPLTEVDRESSRYRVSSMIDDLTDAGDAGEAACVAGDLFVAAAQLFLAHECRWFGNGKWLAKQLREVDPDIAEQLLFGFRSAANGHDFTTLLAASRAVLNRAGGWLQDGFYQRAPADSRSETKDAQPTAEDLSATI